MIQAELLNKKLDFIMIMLFKIDAFTRKEHMEESFVAAMRKMTKQTADSVYFDLIKNGIDDDMTEIFRLICEEETDD